MDTSIQIVKVAICTRTGDCFPNIISRGLSDLLNQLRIEHKVFDNSIPFLMRLLPLNEKPTRWHNSFHYRVYNKLKYHKQDRQLLQQLKKFDIIILSECLPNAFWKNYLAIETLKEKLNKPVLSYTDAYIENAPLHRKLWLGANDNGAERFAKNLCPSPVTELKSKENDNWKAIGVNISVSGLKPVVKKEIIAVVDFAQKGYEAYREQQLSVLKKLGIKTIVLEGRYPIKQIREIYQQAAMFFLAFPETFGLPIAECLAGGAYIFTPQSGWPMAWRLDEQPMPWGPGKLADCFKVYANEDELVHQLVEIIQHYDKEKTPLKVFDSFMRHYPTFYYGDGQALKEVLSSIHMKNRETK